jgi:hypothetical protein
MAKDSVMQLLVDFNMVEEDGRIPVLLSPGQVLFAGSEVLATDGEGTELRAVIDEVATNGRYVMLMPIEGSLRSSSVSSDQ